MKTFLLFIVFLFFGFLISFMTRKNTKVHLPTLQKPSPMPTDSFSIEPPPKQTISGSVLTFSGTVLWQSRLATKPVELGETEKVQQAEKIITELDSSVSIDFPEIALLKIMEETELSFIQTLPNEFVFVQPRGLIEYEVVGETPLSVRSLNALVQFKKGNFSLETDVENGTITITSTVGNAKIAYNDLEYRTIIVEIPEGKTYTYNNETRDGELE